MESYFLQHYVSDNESSVGGGDGDSGNNSNLCAGVTLSVDPPWAAAPITQFQCWDCFFLFTTEAALIQHQLQMCSFAAKSMGFVERLRQAQQQARIPASLSKRPFTQFLFLVTEEGSGTNDPSDDGNMTFDLVSRMDHDFVGSFGNAVGARVSAAAGAFNGEITRNWIWN